jgi:uncharacterized protein (TIGR00255 family)
MTGYGRGEHEDGGMQFSVEVRSVNHRYCDISVKLPRTMTYLETRLKQLAMKYISRGKADVFVTYNEYGVDSTVIRVDEKLADAYFQAFSQLKNRYGFSDNITLTGFSVIPGIMKADKIEADEDAMWEILKAASTEAFEQLKSMREKEGDKLVNDIRDKISGIKGYVAVIEQRAPSVVVEYKARLVSRIKELLEQQDTALDENRIAAEVAMFADRSSVDEEIVRLKSHISQIEKSLALSEPIGRKLDFIVQELNRESNTIGSKSNDLEINRQVVELKSEIEKIREQVQNIE